MANIETGFEKKPTRRVVALLLLCILIFSLGVVRLFDFQIVNGDDYLQTAEKKSESTIIVPAARGEIVDRNGVPLTKNKVVFNVEFDYSFIDKENLNETIYKLICLFEKHNVKWVDELPISLTTPYTFDQDKEKEIKRLKEKINVNDYTTAGDCLENIYRDNGIKKYKTDKDKCTHCGKKFEECDYKPYSEAYSRKIAGVRYQMVTKDFSRYTRRFTFAEDIPPTMTALIKEFSSELSGVKIVERSIRTYISGNFASHLLGSVGPIYAEEAANYTADKGYLQTDIVGKDGIEKAMEEQLRGRYGTKKVIEDSRGNIIEEIDSVEPVAGKTVQLTLDIKFQEELQKIVANYIDNYNKTNKEGKTSTSASVVVLDTKNNGVLASVSYPYYDINDYKTKYAELSKDPTKPLFNRAFNGSYAPGSTFKPIVATAALNEKKATVSSTVSCKKVYTFFGTGPTAYKPKCFTGPHGNIAVSEAIHHSCNIYFYDVGRIMGIKTINKYAEYFGLGVDTGIEIGAKTGHLSSKEYANSIGAEWQAGDVVQAAIGQGFIQISPLQMATEAATLANQGKRFQTHVVKSVLSNDQKTVEIPETKKVMSELKIDDGDFAAIKEGMMKVASGFSAVKALPYPIALKTGTPQVTTVKFNSACVGFAPAENPEIAISIMVEDGNSAGALSAEIISAYEKTKK